MMTDCVALLLVRPCCCNGLLQTGHTSAAAAATELPLYVTLHYMLQSKQEWEPHSGANGRLIGGRIFAECPGRALHAFRCLCVLLLAARSRQRLLRKRLPVEGCLLSEYLSTCNVCMYVWRGCLGSRLGQVSGFCGPEVLRRVLVSLQGLKSSYVSCLPHCCAAIEES
jgi:hypothetical protein